MLNCVKVVRDAYKVAATEGRKSGLAEGFSNAKKETAKNLLKLGIDIHTISKATGLSKDEIENLNND